MALPDFSTMTIDEIADWMQHNDLSELIATARPATEFDDLPTGPAPSELPTIYCVPISEAARTAIEAAAAEHSMSATALIRQIVEQWTVAQDDPHRMVDAEAVINAVNSLRSAA